MKKGFTLAEIMVVVAVLAVIGTVVLAIFIRTLRGTNKAQILSAIKQNGQSVLETMDKTIRSSDNVVCVSNDNPSRSIVIVKNGLYTRYRFVLDPTNDTNGSTQQDNPTAQATETTPTPFINRVCQWNDPLSSANILTDTNPQTGVSVASGSFTRSRQVGFRDIVTIKFDLVPGVKAPQVVAGQIDPVTFQTTIELR